MKIIRKGFPLEIAFEGEELDLDQWVLVKKRFKKRTINVKIGEHSIKIGDRVKFEKGTNKEYVVLTNRQYKRKWL